MKKVIALLSFITAFNLTAQKSMKVVVFEQPIVNGTDTVYGTLNIAKNKSNPLIIIIPGSGPTDRDGNSLALQGKNNSYQMLADSLLSSNISSFRYDKPGIAKSKTSKTEDQMRFDDNTLVVQLIIEEMNKLGFENIYLLGHSEGSLIAILAAHKEKVKGLISLAGAARNAADVLKTQLQSSPALLEEIKTSASEKIDSIRQGFSVKKYNIMLASIFREPIQPYLKSWFKYTPTEEIAKLKIPVLVLQGKLDSQVPTAAAEALHHYAADSKLILYPNMNHVLKTIKGESENLASYTNPDFPLQSGLVNDIANWVNR